MRTPEKQKFFQISLLIFFGACGLGGVIALAMFQAGGDNSVSAPITIWGPAFAETAFKNVSNQMKEEMPSFENVTYVPKHHDTMYGDLLEAVATGASPDLVIIDSEYILPLQNKVVPISFETLSKSQFRDTYVEGAEIFMLSDATYAFPLVVDPLVLYWNRDLFANEAIAVVPKDWDTFVNLVPRLTKITGGSDITQSAVAFGEYDNVLHAKEILISLFMQTGISMVTSAGTKDDERGTFRSGLSVVGNIKKHPELAMKFYTSFSNPIKTVYSWNKTFERSREAFAANKVAMYGGFVSEEDILTEINPNLNFDMSVWPQSNNDHSSVTFGRFYGIATMRASQHPKVAMYVARVLSTQKNASIFSEIIGLPSVNRVVVSETNEKDPFSDTKAKSAIIAKSWLEPAPRTEVETIFKNAINNVVAGTIDESGGVSQISSDLDVLLSKYD